MELKNFKLNISNYIAHLSIDRPEKANSLTIEAWNEMQSVFEELDIDDKVRVIILSGEGKNFCAGMDLQALMSIQQFASIDGEARKREKLRKFIISLQNNINAIEKCRKPVIAAIHNSCIGGGVDLITACDMRYCTDDSTFSVKEIDLGIVADMGTLQRLPKIVGQGIASEMAYTGRNVSGKEAEKIGLVNQSFQFKEEMISHVNMIAKTIAEKSPVCIRGTKEMLLYQRDHSTTDSLNYMAGWNAAMLLSNDLMESMSAFMEKRKPVFKD